MGLTAKGDLDALKGPANAAWYSLGKDAASVFRASDGNAHLNLITCKGSWNKTQKAYTGRLVVFADKLTE